jgi:hypothetical protein
MIHSYLVCVFNAVPPIQLSKSLGTMRGLRLRLAIAPLGPALPVGGQRGAYGSSSGRLIDGETHGVHVVLEELAHLFGIFRECFADFLTFCCLL